MEKRVFILSEEKKTEDTGPQGDLWGDLKTNSLETFFVGLPGVAPSRQRIAAPVMRACRLPGGR